MPRNKTHPLSGRFQNAMQLNNNWHHNVRRTLSTIVRTVGTNTVRQKPCGERLSYTCYRFMTLLFSYTDRKESTLLTSAAALRRFSTLTTLLKPMSETIVSLPYHFLSRNSASRAVQRFSEARADTFTHCVCTSDN